MTPMELAEKLHLKVINEGEGSSRAAEGIYCCDLLSIVMGRARAGDVWITVMGNINSIAVAVLSDVSCIILSENMQLDREALSKAVSQDVCVLSTELPTYEIAAAVGQKLGR